MSEMTAFKKRLFGGPCNGKGDAAQGLILCTTQFRETRLEKMYVSCSSLLFVGDRGTVNPHRDAVIESESEADARRFAIAGHCPHVIATLRHLLS